MSDLLQFFDDRTPDMVDLLRRLVLMESPSTSKEHVDKLGLYVAERCRAIGADVTLYPGETSGDIPFAVWNGDAPGKPIMILTHVDTVWPVGTLETMPLRELDGVLYGPGVLDMKAGLAIALETMRGLVDRGEIPHRPIWLFVNSDEEIGSPQSRALIIEKAGFCGLVLVMEPASEGEALKTWRKGIARYTVRTLGRASHAGQAPESGINAVIEAAHQALYLHSLNDLPNGTSVSVTVIKGGIATNVIPPEASMDVDVRFLKAAEAARVDTAIQNLTPRLPGAAVTVEGGVDRGPMERDEQMIRAFRYVQEMGRSLGLELPEGGSGGGSDGNFTAAMGIPTLDGMGGDGLGLHAVHEQVHIRSLHRRAALLAKVLIDWDMDAV
jgi:glutamate carboxypeptidase